MGNAHCLKASFLIDCDRYSLTVTIEWCYIIFEFLRLFSKTKANTLYQRPSYNLLVKHHFPARVNLFECISNQLQTNLRCFRVFCM